MGLNKVGHGLIVLHRDSKFEARHLQCIVHNFFVIYLLFYF